MEGVLEMGGEVAWMHGRPLFFRGGDLGWEGACMYRNVRECERTLKPFLERSRACECVGVGVSGREGRWGLGLDAALCLIANPSPRLKIAMQHAVHRLCMLQYNL